MTNVIRRTLNDVETEYSHVESTAHRKQNEMPTSQITVPRVEVNENPLDESDDEIFIRENGTDQYGGVLKNVLRVGGSSTGTVQLITESFERYAKDAPPTAPKQKYEEGTSDKRIVQDALAGVDELSEGTIEEIESDVEVLFMHATRALQIRLMRALSKGEIRYNADKTVDYLLSVGSDKTGTVISPSNQNITDMRKLTRTGGPHKTHLRVVGAGNKSVDVVADNFDPSSDREKWARALWKQVGTKRILRKLGKQLLSELQKVWLEVEAEVTGIDPSIGDTFTIDYPEQDIDSRELRVAEMKTRRDDDGTHHDVTFSNRSFAREHKAQSDQTVVDQQARTGQGSAMQNVPAVNFPMVNLAAGKELDQRVQLPPDSRLHLWWFTIEIEDDASPTRAGDACFQVVLNPGGGFSTFERKIYENCVVSGREGNPILTVNANEDDDRVAFRLKNTGDSDLAMTSAASFTIERFTKA